MFPPQRRQRRRGLGMIMFPLTVMMWWWPLLVVVVNGGGDGFGDGDVSITSSSSSSSSRSSSVVGAMEGFDETMSARRMTTRRRTTTTTTNEKKDEDEDDDESDNPFSSVSESGFLNERDRILQIPFHYRIAYNETESIRTIDDAIAILQDETSDHLMGLLDRESAPAVLLDMTSQVHLHDDDDHHHHHHHDQDQDDEECLAIATTATATTDPSDGSSDSGSGGGGCALATSTLFVLADRTKWSDLTANYATIEEVRSFLEHDFNARHRDVLRVDFRGPRSVAHDIMVRLAPVGRAMTPPEEGLLEKALVDVVNPVGPFMITDATVILQALIEERDDDQGGGGGNAGTDGNDSSHGDGDNEHDSDRRLSSRRSLPSKRSSSKQPQSTPPPPPPGRSLDEKTKTTTKTTIADYVSVRVRGWCNGCETERFGELYDEVIDRELWNLVDRLRIMASAATPPTDYFSQDPRGDHDDADLTIGSVTDLDPNGFYVDHYRRNGGDRNRRSDETDDDDADFPFWSMYVVGAGLMVVGIGMIVSVYRRGQRRWKDSSSLLSSSSSSLFSSSSSSRKKRRIMGRGRGRNHDANGSSGTFDSDENNHPQGNTGDHDIVVMRRMDDSVIDEEDLYTTVNLDEYDDDDGDDDDDDDDDDNRPHRHAGRGRRDDNEGRSSSSRPKEGTATAPPPQERPHEYRYSRDMLSDDDATFGTFDTLRAC